MQLVEIILTKLHVELSRCTDTMVIETQGQLLVDIDMDSLPKCQTNELCTFPPSLIEILPMEVYTELPQCMSIARGWSSRRSTDGYLGPSSKCQTRAFIKVPTALVLHQNHRQIFSKALMSWSFTKKPDWGILQCTLKVGPLPKNQTGAFTRVRTYAIGWSSTYGDVCTVVVIYERHLKGVQIQPAEMCRYVQSW